MPLVLPLLRLLLLFVNVYETFKTLRPPRGGPRTGQPSIRAVSQRKRDMKGCMTVWLLWVSWRVLRASDTHFLTKARDFQCCCTMFERNCDPVFGLVVPFYGEFKSLVYVFQLVTRARVGLASSTFATSYKLLRCAGSRANLFACYSARHQAVCGHIGLVIGFSCIDWRFCDATPLATRTNGAGLVVSASRSATSGSGCRTCHNERDSATSSSKENSFELEIDDPNKSAQRQWVTYNPSKTCYGYSWNED